MEVLSFILHNFLKFLKSYNSKGSLSLYEPANIRLLLISIESPDIHGPKTVFDAFFVRASQRNIVQSHPPDKNKLGSFSRNFNLKILLVCPA